MECEHFEASVLDLLYREGPPEKRDELDEHARSCEPCGKLAHELEEARALAATLPQRVKPPREVDDRILVAARLAAEMADVRRAPLRGSSLHVAAAAFLAVLLASGAFALGAKFSKRPPRVERGEDDPGPITGVTAGYDRPNRSPLRRDPEINEVSRKWKEDQLTLANKYLEEKRPRDALELFIGIYTSTDVAVFQVEASLGMAKSYRDLGKRLKAQLAIRETLTLIHELGVAVDPKVLDEAEKLGNELGQPNGSGPLINDEDRRPK